MITQNITIRSNVICKKIWDEDGKLVAEVSDTNVVPRLTYWELFGLWEALPGRFPASNFDPARLTGNQSKQVRAFFQGDDVLWPGAETFKPFNIDCFPNGKRSIFSTEFPFPPVSHEEINKLLQTAETSGGENKEELSEKLTDVSGTQSVLQTISAEPNLPSKSDSLIDYQLEFINEPLGASHLIFAPPGTGKTHALIERINHIVKDADLEDPSLEIVVLSFSKAAVREIRKRVTGAVGSGRDGDFEYITVRTFDSFATNILMLDLDYEHLNSGRTTGNGSSFDFRIHKFNNLFETGHMDKGLQRIDKIRFLFVDEVQDLCDVRAAMVKVLVARVLGNGHSVALLGDPAQGIYDWQTKETGGITSRQFLKTIEYDHGKILQKIQFQKYYRYENDSMLAFAREVAQAVGDGDEPQATKLQKLTDENCRKVNPIEIKRILSELGSVAVLTRKNIESWQLADYCRRFDIPFEIHRGAGSRKWPEWIGRLTQGFRQDKMSNSMFDTRWNQLLGCYKGLNSSQAWNVLESEGFSKNGTLDLANLNRRILSEEASENLLTSKHTSSFLFISTIHKSKGMEFPYVLVLAGKQDSLMKSSEEARIFYVAVTRAKKELILLKREKSVFTGGRKLYHGIYHYFSRDARGAYMDENQWDFLSITEENCGVSVSEELMVRRQNALWDIWTAKDRNLKVPFLQLKVGEPYWLMLPSKEGNIPLMKNWTGVDKDLDWVRKIAQKKMAKQFNGYSAEICGMETIALEQTELNKELIGNACLLLRPVLTERVLLEEDNG